MALDFNILDFEFDEKHRIYNARIRIQENVSVYQIRCINGKLRYYSWASPGLRLMICDSEDRVAENGEVSLIVSSEDKYAKPEAVQRELIKFMHSQHII